MASFGLPWNIPQSIRTRARPVSSRYWEPVTVVAPPRKWRSICGVCIGRSGFARGSADGAHDDRIERDRGEQQREVGDRIPVEPDRARGRLLLRVAATPQAVRLAQEQRAEPDRRHAVER